MSILSPNATQFQLLVKKLSDGALSQALQMHADPSDPKGFWLAQEAMGRAAARKEAQAGNANPPTVVQQLAKQLTPQPPAPPQGMPPMPPQGVPGMGAMPPMPQVAAPMPPQGMPPQMPPMPPQMPPQAPPVAMAQAGGHVHDYGIAGLPYMPRYEHGGIVSFAKGGDEGMDEGLYEGQSFEGYNPDDPSQMLAELDTKGRSKENQQQLEADTDAANVLTALRSIVTGPALGLAGAADVGTMIPRAFGSLAWERGKDGKLTRNMDSPDFNWFPATEAVKNWAEAPIGDDFVSTRYDPNSDNAPPPKEKFKPITSNVFSAANPNASAPPKTEAAPFNPNWLVSANAPPSLAQASSDKTPPTAPRRIVEVTSKPPAVSAGITTPRVGAGTGNAPTLIKDEPQEYTPEKEAENRRFEEDLQRSYGYNPNLNADFLAENAKDIEALKKESGLQSIRDIGNALAAFSGADSDAKGFVAFSQQLGKNFAESDKAMDMKKDALKKYNRELRLAENDIRNNKVEKGMARRVRAEEQIAQAKVKYTEAQNAFIIEQYKQKREDMRKEMEEANANLRNERSVRAEELRALAVREAATQDKLNSFFTSGLLTEEQFVNLKVKFSKDIDSDDVASYISTTTGVAVDPDKLTEADIEKYTDEIANIKVTNYVEQSRKFIGGQKKDIAEVLYGSGRGLGSFTASPLPQR